MSAHLEDPAGNTVVSYTRPRRKVLCKGRLSSSTEQMERWEREGIPASQPGQPNHHSDEGNDRWHSRGHGVVFVGVRNSHTEELHLCEWWRVGRGIHMHRGMETLEMRIWRARCTPVRRGECEVGGFEQVGRVLLWSLNVMPKRWDLCSQSLGSCHSTLSNGMFVGRKASWQDRIWWGLVWSLVTGHWLFSS